MPSDMEPYNDGAMIVFECDVHLASVNLPPRPLVMPVGARIAQWQREEAAGRVEALARGTEDGQAEPSLRLRVTGQRFTMRDNHDHNHDHAHHCTRCLFISTK